MSAALPPLTDSQGLARPKTASVAPLAADAVTIPDLATLSLQQLTSMRLAGEEILTCYRVLKKSGLNLVGEVLRDSLNAGQTFYELEHYPPD
ncbi:MAG: hypothetical protein PHF58_10310, partial [Methylotenera sp.]|nr:hypothetical protein [Methylotenera sp.]